MRRRGRPKTTFQDVLIELTILALLYSVLMPAGSKLIFNNPAIKDGLTPGELVTFFKAAIPIFQWGAVASWGFASACFGLYRTLDEFKEYQRSIRFCGVGFLKVAIYSMLTLAASFGMANTAGGTVEYDFSSRPIGWNDPPFLILGTFWVIAASGTIINAVVELTALLKELWKGLPRTQPEPADT